MKLEDPDKRARSGFSVRAFLLRSLVIVGIVVTPIWLGLLGWLAYRTWFWVLN